jgi:putative spermidine/putrescine transport system permease protein
VTRSTRRAAKRLAAPGLALVILFLVPLAIMVRESLVVRAADGTTRASLDQYARFAGDAYYAGALVLTFATASLVAVLAIVLAYPIAVAYWRASRRIRALMLILLLAPFYANIVVTVFGWIVLLSPGGMVNGLLTASGAISSPLDLLNGYPAIVAVSIHRCLPFVVLLIASALATIDDDVLQSARVCGAGDVRVFRTIVVPLSMPGIVSSAVVAFSFTAAGFVIPRLVGGATGARFVPVLMYQQIAVTQNWRFGAALGVLLLTAAVVIVAAGMWMVKRLRAGRVLGDAFVQ